MIDRFHFWLTFVGSAAVVALLAACLSSPRIATFTCHASSVDTAERCELDETLAARTAAGDDAGAADPTPDAPAPAPVALASAH